MWPFWRLCWAKVGVFLKSHSKMLTDSITAKWNASSSQIIFKMELSPSQSQFFLLWVSFLWWWYSFYSLGFQDQTALPLTSPLLPLLRSPSLSAVLYISPFPTFTNFVFFPSIQLTCSLNIYCMLGTVLEAGYIMINIVDIRGAARLYGIFMWIIERITLLKILNLPFARKSLWIYLLSWGTLMQDTTYIIICGIHSSQGMFFALVEPTFYQRIQ